MIFVHYSHIHSLFSFDDIHSFPLPNFYKRKLLKYRSIKDAELSLGGRVLLKHILREHFNVNLDFNNILDSPLMKPVLSGMQINFNISHSGDICICAVSDKGQVGIDIERIQNIDIADFKFKMTDKEWKRLSVEREPDHFFEYWTQKEAVLKASGKGLSIELNTFEVDDHKTFVDGRQWYLLGLNVDRHYKCCLASENAEEIKKINLRRYYLTKQCLKTHMHNGN